jgi:hypothetical protein
MRLSRLLTAARPAASTPRPPSKATATSRSALVLSSMGACGRKKQQRAAHNETLLSSTPANLSPASHSSTTHGVQGTAGRWHNCCPAHIKPAQTLPRPRQHCCEQQGYLASTQTHLHRQMNKKEEVKYLNMQAGLQLQQLWCKSVTCL